MIIAIPHTTLTDKMISKKELELLGKEGLLINVARGDIIDEEALYSALKEKKITGAAIDVWFDNAPKEKDGKKYPFHFPFNELDNIVFSPHRGYSPFSDLLRWDEIVENLSRIAKGKSDLINIVNLEHEY
jgi:phosphoglycerate dehydrogenase-like enzyme